jgi:hypothetical protein
MIVASPEGSVATQNVSDAQEIELQSKPSGSAAGPDGGVAQIGLIPSAVHDVALLFTAGWP